MILNIDVNQSRINHGKPRSGCSCPITLAVIAELDRLEIEYKTVVTSQTYVKVSLRSNSRDKYELLELPHQAIRFIRLFDDNLPVKPFSFTLEMK